MNISQFIIITILALNQPDEDLFKKGVYLFEHQDFKQSISVLSRIINNNLAKDENELAECYRYLGAAHFYLEDYKAAEANFRQLLFLRPDTKLDPFLFPPSMVVFFDRIKKDMPKSSKDLKETEPVQTKYRYSLYVNLLPFGIPQFAQNRNVKGSLILSSQILSLGVNVFSYWQVQSMIDRYGYVKDQKTADRANLLKTAQITSLITFGIIYFYSVGDGIYYSQREQKGGK
ncbi:MAG: hypothetical protein N3B13_02485 [Deltaproteobacteria bacterium]|nr:hypothetical protein [Deltaproteobacteria bacterium]